MALILNLETATTVCSVALARDGELLSLKEINEDYTHAENLTVFIEEVLAEAHIDLKSLDAIAVSKGPGSYTGLRIGVSTAKGLCYALDKPLIAINTLKHLSLTLSPSFVGINAGEGTAHRPRYFTTDRLTWNSSIINAKQHRKNPTKEEAIMWESLRAKQLGYKIRRQHPIDKYIVDFVCLDKKLIIEIDGKIHQSQQQEDYDRTQVLIKSGFRVIRFTNEEVIYSIDNILTIIKMELEKPIAFCSLSFGEGRGEVLFCPMIDARRMEVYCAIYDSENEEIRKTAAEIIDENSFSDLLENHQIVFFGDGAAKCKETLAHNKNAMFIDNIVPSAQGMISLSERVFVAKQFEDIAYFEPFYLKDFVGGVKSK